MQEHAKKAEHEKTNQKPAEPTNEPPTLDYKISENSKYPWESYKLEEIFVNNGSQMSLGFYFPEGRISIYKIFEKKSKWTLATFKKEESEKIVDGIGFETVTKYIQTDQIELDNVIFLVSEKKKSRMKSMINTAGFPVKKNAGKIIEEVSIKMVEHIEEIDVEKNVSNAPENQLPVFVKVENPSWSNVLKNLRTGMYIEDPVPYTVGLTTFISNKIEDNEPVWMMQIGVPGIGKTVFTKHLMPDDIYSNAWVIQLSDLTSKAFVSGKEDVEDLLPIVLGKVLLFSDFTVMLSKEEKDVLAIFNQLREMYDGKYAKAFGSGVGVKHHKGTFTILANVTNKYDTFKNRLSAVGDRFISVRFLPSSHEFSKKITASAYNNIRIDPEISKAISSEMLTLYDNFNPDELPPISKDWDLDIQHCAMITAALRIPIERDMRRKGNPIITKPAKEEPTRLIKVYKKLAHVLCYVLEKPEFDLEVLSYIYRITLDTPEEMRVIVLKNVKQMCSEIDEIAERTEFGTDTIHDVLVDLKYAGLIKIEQEELNVGNREGSGPEVAKGNTQYFLNGVGSPIIHYIQDIETKLSELPDDKRHHNCIGIKTLNDLEN